MNSAPRIIRWHEGRVDRTKEHFELRYGSAKDGGWDEWIPAALVGPPTNGVLIVQFIVEPSDPRIADIVRDVKKDIQFMCELNEPDHWNYFKYHSTTMSNMYGTVHWSFFSPDKGWSVLPVRVKVIRGKLVADRDTSENSNDSTPTLFENGSSALIREKRHKKSTGKLSINSKNPTFQIVDTTEASIGKSMIITGAAPPKKPLTPAEREEALRKATEIVTEKPPGKK